MRGIDTCRKHNIHSRQLAQQLIYTVRLKGADNVRVKLSADRPVLPQVIFVADRSNAVLKYTFMKFKEFFICLLVFCALV